MKLEATQALIANGTALSGVLDLRSTKIRGIILPSSWTAAGITFQTCDTATGTFVDVVTEAGAIYVLTAVAAQAVVVSSLISDALAYTKIRSGTASTGASPVNQGADRNLVVLGTSRGAGN